MLAGNWEDFTGQEFQGRYALLSLVSAGPRQAEFAARTAPPSGTPEPLSVTLMLPDAASLEQQLAHIETARRLAHPNLLRIVDGGECTFRGIRLLFVVTEAGAAPLAQVIEKTPLGLAQASELTRDLIAGLDYIHEQGLVCASLDPDTVVRSGARWQLADLSQLHPPGRIENGLAGPNPPPEASLGSIEPPWDTWALGTTLSAVLPDEVRRDAVFDAIVKGCLQPDPSRRLGLPEIGKLLEKGERAPADVLPPAAPPHRAVHRFPVIVLSVGFAVVLLAVVVAVLALREKPAAAPIKAALVKPPAPAAILPVRRPSPFAGEIETERKRSPAPPANPQPARSTKALKPATQPAMQTETAERSGSPEGSYLGQANYFADNLNGQPTASGEPFSNTALTAAHASLPFGARVRVTNLANGKSVIVRVNDRAASNQRTIISVTRSGAEQLGFVQAGSARVKIEPLP